MVVRTGGKPVKSGFFRLSPDNRTDNRLDNRPATGVNFYAAHSLGSSSCSISSEVIS